MDDLFNTFDEDKKEYVEIKLSGAKLSDREYEAKFGKERYKSILLDDDIKRYLADKKIDEAKKKEHSKNLKLALLMDVETRMKGLRALENILAEGPDHKDYFNAGKALMKGDESYAAQKGKQIADAEGDQTEVQVFQFAYKLSKEE